MGWRLLFCFLIVLAPTFATAQSTYPLRNVSLLFGFPAGTDVGARAAAEKLAERLGKPIVFENVPGAAGNIAADRTASAPADGYTIGLLTGANIVIRPLLSRNAPQDPLSQLVPISLVYRFPNVLIANNDVATSLGELVEKARAAPGTITFGHLGHGSVTHLSGELLRARAEIDIRSVPYTATAPFMTDLITGRIAMAFVPPSLALPYLREGKVRALAVTSQARVPFAPDLPTVAEQGYPGFEISVWFGLFAPTGAPQAIVDRLADNAASIMRQPDMQQRFNALGLVPVGSTQAAFREAIDDEKKLWTKLISDRAIGPTD